MSKVELYYDMLTMLAITVTKAAKTSIHIYDASHADA
jgi:predicted ATPase